MKTKLTIEESAELIELGIDPNLASKDSFFVSDDKRAEYFDNVEMLTGKRDFPKGVFQKREKPYVNGRTSWNIYHKVFTLDDILSILPKELNDGVTTFHLNIDYPMPNHVAARYVDPDDGDNDILGVMCNELIDTLNALLKRTIKSGFNHLKFQ